MSSSLLRKAECAWLHVRSPVPVLDLSVVGGVILVGQGRPGILWDAIAFVEPVS